MVSFVVPLMKHKTDGRNAVLVIETAPQVIYLQKLCPERTVETKCSSSLGGRRSNHIKKPSKRQVLNTTHRNTDSSVGRRVAGRTSQAY